ncbi:putative methylesterase 11, chloroplastic [Capsicum chinense]|nr:putative methylesterase 11, chloroplastic [Capsicum chinense]
MSAWELPTTSGGVNDDQFTTKCSPLLEHVYGILDDPQVSDDVDIAGHEIVDDSLSMMCDESLTFAHRHREVENVVENDQSGENDLKLLECLENSNGVCSCKNDFDHDPFVDHGGLYLGEDYPFERGGETCLEIPSTFSLCVSYVEHDHSEGLETSSECMHENTNLRLTYRTSFSTLFLFMIFPILIKKGTILESLEIRHFVLVHGGSFGTWCWYKTTILLKETGYQVDALDLTGSGAHYFDFDNITTFPEYVKPLTNFIENLSDGIKVILVGHDIGGDCVSSEIELHRSKVSKAISLL